MRFFKKKKKYVDLGHDTHARAHLRSVVENKLLHFIAVDHRRHAASRRAVIERLEGPQSGG